MPDLISMRRDYDGGSAAAAFSEETLAATWLEQFQRWFDDAVAAGLSEPNAVVVATADADGAPDARIVLVKAFDDAGFVFGTSYASAKGAQLALDDRVALVFPWHEMQRQVRVVGTAERLDDAGSDALWDPRPRGAQLAAAASVQSSTVASRDELVAAARLLDEQTTTDKLPRPASWGGYRVTPQRVEFWQGGHDRLHDRLVFDRDEEEGGWAVRRLAP